MFRFILSIVLLFVSAQAGDKKHHTTASPDLPVPGTGFYQLGDSYYAFLTILKSTYYQAVQFCNSYGMELVSIETPEENQFLYETLGHLLGKAEYDLWTSGTALVSDQHVFYWLSTGQKVGYANWQVNQPDDDGGTEECLAVIYNKKEYSSLVWNDDVCSKKKYFICELRSSLCKNELDSECSPFKIIKE